MLHFLEKLASVQHEIWAEWMKYVLNERASKQEDGSVILSADDVERWTRQATAYYDELSEREKNVDRTEALRFYHLIQEKIKNPPVS